MTEPVDQPKQYIVAHVSEALAHDPRVGELDIHVKVVGDQVFLKGSVATAARKKVVGRVVQELLPDHRVHNEVAVTTTNGAPETEELE
jgi:hypothetical protein